tara:strand:- start:594 stop:1925 length:1332 start_codon:yes stop_codon:yes gene_type:complete
MSSISPHTEVGYVKRYRRSGKPYGNYFGFYRFPEENQENKINLKIRDKRFAQQKLREIIAHQHAVRTGLSPSDERVQAAGKPLVEYIEEYTSSMKARQLKVETIRKIGPMLRRLCDDCGWHRIADLSGSQYETWRGKVDLSAKSKNHYLHAASAFVNWLITLQVCERNPFKGIRPARVVGNERRPRRALAVEEVNRLVGCCPCPRRRMIYMLAFATAARTGEMEGFRWSDFDLSPTNPTITYRNSNSKTKKPERNPIPQWLADALREYKPEDASPDDLVFTKWMGRHTLDEDLKRAGVPKLNEHGESACLYSLRHAFNQTMQEAGIPFRHAQRFMRHSDPKHTANTYLDSDGLDLRGSIDRMPAIQTPSSTARSVVGVVEEWTEVSGVVSGKEEFEAEKTAISVPERQSVSKSDTDCPDTHRQWSRGESNPRAEIVSNMLLRV